MRARTCRGLQAAAAARQVEEKLKFVMHWIVSHIEDGDKELGKPVLTTEFGLSHRATGFDHSHREFCTVTFG